VQFIIKQINKHRCKKFVCDRCLNYFNSNDKLKNHTTLCEQKNFGQITFPPYDYEEFKNYCYKQTTPFVIYADFESILERKNDEVHYQKHTAFSVGYYFKCDYDDTLSFYKTYCNIKITLDAVTLSCPGLPQYNVCVSKIGELGS